MSNVETCFFLPFMIEWESKKKYLKFSSKSWKMMFKGKMKIKTLLGIIGITLTITGWFVSHGEDITWVKHLLARQYIVAVETYENMIKNKSAVKEGEPGFKQLAEILSEKLEGSGDLIISEIRILDHAFSFKSYDTGMKGVPTISVEITLRDGRKTQTSSMDDLRPELEKRYFKKSIFNVGTGIFWIGILVGILLLFLEQKNITDQSP
jgi:hypothetical protein